MLRRHPGLGVATGGRAHAVRRRHQVLQHEGQGRRQVALPERQEQLARACAEAEAKGDGARRAAGDSMAFVDFASYY